MSETAETHRRSAAGTPLAGAVRALARRRFELAVAAITAAPAAFLGHQLLAWPPHEDETLALFVGRHSLTGLFDTVLHERGGAPLHFLLAWAVAHTGGGLGALRAVSAALAVASLPLVALLGARLVGRRPALVATALTGASWTLLFHGVYGRMYSLFLLTSLLSLLALSTALDRGGRRAWSLWVLAMLAVVATHPYGALVLGGQAVFVLWRRRDRLREAALAGGAVALLGTPFWLTALVLAGRFDVGVGGGGEKLGGPVPVLSYLLDVAGDFGAGYRAALWGALALAALGLVTLWRTRRDTAALALSLAVVPTVALLLAKLGSAASPESRHLIFLLPFYALAVAAGLERLRATRVRALVPLALSALLVAQVAWAWHRTPPLFEWEPDQRQAARAEASAYLAATGRPDDLLFGYDPLFLGAWERDGDFAGTVVPRADSRLALRTLRKAEAPLGRGVWILDASRPNNVNPRLQIEMRTPSPAAEFEARAFGPFLVIRTDGPTLTPRRYLELAGRALLLGKSLQIGDADINLLTVDRAARKERGYGAARSLSRVSR